MAEVFTDLQAVTILPREFWRSKKPDNTKVREALCPPHVRDTYVITNTYPSQTIHWSSKYVTFQKSPWNSDRWIENPSPLFYPTSHLAARLTSLPYDQLQLPPAKVWHHGGSHSSGRPCGVAATCHKWRWPTKEWPGMTGGSQWVETRNMFGTEVLLMALAKLRLKCELCFEHVHPGNY